MPSCLNIVFTSDAKKEKVIVQQHQAPSSTILDVKIRIDTPTIHWIVVQRPYRWGYDHTSSLRLQYAENVVKHPDGIKGMFKYVEGEDRTKFSPLNIPIDDFRWVFKLIT